MRAPSAPPSPAIPEDWPADIPFPPKNLPSEDGEPLETNWHRDAMNFLIELIRVLYRGRSDYCVGGNNFIYFSPQQLRNEHFRGPDVFLVKDVDGSYQREYWSMWDEGNRLPDLIIELTSPSTAEVDRTVKKDIYE